MPKLVGFGIPRREKAKLRILLLCGADVPPAFSSFFRSFFFLSLSLSIATPAIREPHLAAQSFIRHPCELVLPPPLSELRVDWVAQHIVDGVLKLTHSEDAIEGLILPDLALCAARLVHRVRREGLDALRDFRE